jgi:hypothetical protein
MRHKQGMNVLQVQIHGRQLTSQLSHGQATIDQHARGDVTSGGFNQGRVPAAAAAKAFKSQHSGLQRD